MQTGARRYGAGGARRVFTCGRGGIDRRRGRAGRARGGRGPPDRQSASGPRPRGRRCAVLRRAGVSPRADGGGGEPRAARPPNARARSAPPRAARPRARRARSSPAIAPPPEPRLRPVFLWTHLLDGTVHEVHVEDYDPRNRLRIARTPAGWRVIPRTAIFDSIRVPAASRRRRRSEQRARPPPSPPLECQERPPDLESHIPTHTIAVQRAPEPTPLDNLLAVAELELSQQRGEELELELRATPFSFLTTSEPRDAMPYEPTYGRAEPLAPDRVPDSHAHEDLFETISEAHYLPELGGPHDEALLESLVEKGCEDNQILGQALDKLANLVHGTGDYAEEEDDMLLSGAPVADIIDRLEQSLESPSRSSMTAAQGLLHLHHIGDHLPPPDRTQDSHRPYGAEQGFGPAEPPTQCPLDELNVPANMQNVNHLEFEPNAEKRLQSDVEASDTLYTETVPDVTEHFQSASLEEHHLEEDTSLCIPSLPDRMEDALPDNPAGDSVTATEMDDIQPKVEPDESVVPETTIDQNLNDQQSETADPVIKKEPVDDFLKELESTSNGEMIPTDLSVKHVENAPTVHVIPRVAESTNTLEDNVSEKSDDQPKDLSVHRRMPTPHASPRRLDIPRAPSRESDAMQSPQPSGIPAVPSSPEIFTMPHTKSKQALFLETLLSSPSPKMYTSEVTITKQQCEPLNLGKHRKSASPTVTSCSDEIRKICKEFGEPQEKRMRRESTEDITKISRVFNKSDREDQITESKLKKSDKPQLKSFSDDVSPLKQLQVLKTNPEYNIPDPLLIPKDKLNTILASPGREIPALLIQRPELRLPEAFAFPAILQDPDILVVSLSQLETILENEAKQLESQKIKKSEPTTPKSAPSTPTTEQTSTTQPDQTNQPKPIPSMDALAGDIDAATSAALNQMLWLPYISQLEAMAACSQNMDFLKALNSSGYNGPNYPDLSQMFNPSARFMGPAGFPVMPPMDYDNRMQFAMWQEAMNHANAQRSKPAEQSMKEITSITSDVQNPYVHSTKNHHSKSHMPSRTSPMTHHYNSNQRAMQHHPFLQNMYSGMNPNIRPNVPLPGLQIPYFNPNMMGSQRSPRSAQQKSPTSPYYPNNNYLQSVKHPDAQQHQRSSSTGSQESPRPRISVKSLHNLLEPSAASSASSTRRPSNPPAMGRRRDEPEVGSTTQGEPPPMMPPHSHDPASFHLWHPLFGNQKSYNSPWSWTTVTATGD